MKTFVARVKVLQTKKVYVQAKDQKAAQKALTDSVTLKRIKEVDVEITYGDMKETNENVFKSQDGFSHKGSKTPKAAKKVTKPREPKATGKPKSDKHSARKAQKQA